MIRNKRYINKSKDWGLEKETKVRVGYFKYYLLFVNTISDKNSKDKNLNFHIQKRENFPI